ncbi:unnamed protein product [Amoebophrya sp. A25]|nr:unnamed protein product [Amoebophrya sp. A25]|eukprot:GSA25T00004434001.1
MPLASSASSASRPTSRGRSNSRGRKKGAPPNPARKWTKKQQLVEAYVHSYNLERTLNEMMRHVLEEKSDNPKMSMVKFLHGKLSPEQASGISKVWADMKQTRGNYIYYSDPERMARHAQGSVQQVIPPTEPPAGASATQEDGATEDAAAGGETAEKSGTKSTTKSKKKAVSQISTRQVPGPMRYDGLESGTDTGPTNAVEELTPPDEAAGAEAATKEKAADEAVLEEGQAAPTEDAVVADSAGSDAADKKEEEAAAETKEVKKETAPAGASW